MEKPSPGDDLNLVYDIDLWHVKLCLTDVQVAK